MAAVKSLKGTVTAATAETVLAEVSFQYKKNDVYTN